MKLVKPAKRRGRKSAKAPRVPGRRCTQATKRPGRSFTRKKLSSHTEHMEAVKDASHLYEVERRAEHAARPGFRVTELEISPTQKVPWHYHNNVADTFYVLGGSLRIF